MTDRPVPSGPRPGDRRALQSVAVQFFVNGLIVASFIPRLPEIRDRIDVTTGVLGVLLGCAAVAGFIGSAAVGPLISRWGTRMVMICSCVLLVGALAVIGVASSPVVFLVGLALFASTDVLVDSAMNLQGSWISGRRRIPVMNRLHGLWSLGTVIGGLSAAQAAAIGVSLQTHLLVAAAVILAVLVFVGRGLLRDDEHLGHDDDAAERDGAGSTGRRRGPLVVLAVAAGCSVVMEMTSSDWAAFRLSDDFGTSAGVAGLAYVAFTFGMMSGRFGGDLVIARFGQQRVLDLAIGLTMLALVTVSFAPFRWVVLGAYVVAGLGIATQFPKLYDDAARHRGRPGAGLAALTAGSRLSSLVAPPLVGVLAASNLSVGSATALVTIPAALAFVAVTRSSPHAR